MTDFMNYRKAAGLKVEKRSPGRPAKKRPEKIELQRLYVEEGKSIRNIAEILDCTKDLVYRALQEYGFSRRSRIKLSNLNQYSLVYLREKIKEKGFKGAASELGVHRTTLLRFVKEK